ncbi:MAG: BPSS1780 family membrane protein [Pseudomonadota bacterium]
MEKFPARTGWLWVKQGMALFRQQPGGLASLFFVYMFFTIASMLVPLIGPFLPVVFIPVVSVAFMHACLHIEQGRPIQPKLLLSGMRKPAVLPLISLGILYLLLLAMLVAVLRVVDDGILMKLSSGKMDVSAATAAQAQMSYKIPLAVILYLMANLLICFCAPLIYWRATSVGKAIFFSGFAVLRSLGAFIVLGLCWFGIYMVIGNFAALVLGLMGFNGLMMVMVPMLGLLMVIIHCSLYVSYCQVFGKPSLAKSAAS